MRWWTRFTWHPTLVESLMEALHDAQGTVSVRSRQCPVWRLRGGRVSRQRRAFHQEQRTRSMLIEVYGSPLSLAGFHRLKRTGRPAFLMVARAQV